jgi:hypothetical protein
VIPALNGYGDHIQTDGGGQDERGDSDPHAPLHDKPALQQRGESMTGSRADSGFARRWIDNSD